MEVRELVFRNDGTDRWVHCEGRLAELDVEKLPYGIILAGKKESWKRLWLKGRCESIDDFTLKNGVVFQGEEAQEPVLLNTIFYNSHESLVHRSKKHFLLAMRWRLRFDGKLLLLAVDVADVSITSMGSNREPRASVCIWKSYSVTLDFLGGNIRRWPLWCINEWGLQITQPDGRCFECLPAEVSVAAVPFLRQLAADEFGFKPTVMTTVYPERQALAFFHRPLDLNIYLLRKFIGYGKFETFFPVNQADNYTPLCKCLGLGKTPKSLRRAYARTPFAVIAYRMMKDFGFKDVNIIRRSYELEQIGPIHLEDVRWGSQNRLNVSGAADLYEAFQFYCGYLLSSGKKEKYVIHRLIDKSREPWKNWKIDTIKMFHRYFDDISEDIRKRVMRDELSELLHDELAEEVACIEGGRGGEELIFYEPELLAYENKINEFEIRLVHRTNELSEIGEKLHNCVASYKYDVVHHYSTIATVKYHDKYVACLEIKDDGIYQALGPCNRYLTGDVLLAVAYWAQLHNLQDKRGYLNVNLETIDTSAYTVEQLPHQKLLPEMNLEELLAVPADKIHKGYYTYLRDRMLAVKTVNRVAPPPWMTFSDERTYLYYVLPWAKHMIDAAFAGNMEAAAVLGEIYLRGRWITKDVQQGEKWLDFGGNDLSKLLTAEHKQRVAMALGNRDEAIKWGLEVGRLRVQRNMERKAG